MARVDDLSMELNFFAGGSLMRRPDRRADADWIRRRLEAPDCAIVLVRGSSIIFRGPPSSHTPWWRYREVAELVASEEPVYLGEGGDRPYFALVLGPGADPSPSALAGTEEQELKRIGADLDHQTGAILAYARAMAYWHRAHRFCGRCGGPTSISEAGHLRLCTSPDCKARHFPRTDPAVIVLVTRGERCLLIRQPEWPERHFATVAGFVEPGESLRDAVAREVNEEVGLQADRISFHSSQPWPFPGSLMIGFYARVNRGRLRVAEGEVEQARWFARDELMESLGSGELDLPPRVSISFRLIRDWYAAGDRARATRLEAAKREGWSG